MKASEVLTRYAAGERNFQGVNLRGQSFKDQNLSGADFSKADLRSTNFTGTNLQGVNFAGAKCGLQKRWAIFLTVYSCLLASISGIFSILAVYSALLIFDSSLESQIASWISLIVIVIFLILTIRQEIRVGAVAGAVAIAIIVVIAGAVAGTVAGAVVVAGVISLAVAGAISVAVAGVIAGIATGAIAVLVAVVGAIAGTTIAGIGTSTVTVTIASAIAGTVAGIGVYIGWRSVSKDDKDAWLRNFAIDFAATGGTSFRRADLTETNFTGAKLKSTDFKQANLTRVRWYGAKMLDRVRAGNTYLKSTQVRQWLVGKGVDQNFDGQSLRGINLQGADLRDASFISSDLSEANLQDTDLSRAKLVQTLLDKTDFTRAILTGAFIQDWGITSNTVLDGVRCEYVFMRLPTEQNPDPYRKPDNRFEVFADGDFADFIQPIFDTLDLYHNQGVDPRAIAISWKQLLENNPDANLQFASMEVKGEDNLLLKLKTSSNADLSHLSAEYFDTYNKLKTLSEPEIKTLLIEKDSRIRNLENMLITALEKPIIHTINIRNGNIGTINNNGAGSFNLGNIEHVGNIQGLDNINIAGNIEQIGDIKEVDNINIAGNIEQVGNIKGYNNQIYIAGDTRIETITSGLIEGEIENIQNVQTAQLIESNRKDIGIEIVKGSGMLVGQSNELILRVTNTSKKVLDSVSIEIQNSREYEIQSDYSITLDEIKIEEPIDISFKLLMKVAKEIAVNYKINNILQEQPLYIFAIQDNPYIYGTPVQGEISFFGRKDKLDTILQAVIKPTKQDILIVGERRTGKTSLLNQIYKSFKSPLIPVYIVLNTSKDSTAECVLDLILKQVIDKLIQRKILDNNQIKTTKLESLEFIENIRNIIKIAQDNLPDIRVVLLIDEADYLLQIKKKSSNTIDERPQNFLRAVLQSETGTYLRAVVAGTTDLSTYMSQNSSPFYNHFKHSRLKPFSGDETRELIIRPAAILGYEYSEQAIQQIINLSGGQPYYCQALCYESFNNALEFKRQQINEDDVNSSQKKITQDLYDGYISGFWNRFSESEKKLVVALSKNKSLKKLDKVNIKRLIDWNIIVEDSSGSYLFSSGLIKQWTILASK